MYVVRLCETPKIPASHENASHPGVWNQVLLTKANVQPGQMQMLNWATLPGSASFQPHYHEDMQEIFLILHGQVQMRVDHQIVELSDGDCVVIQPREVHQMTNLSSQEAEYIVLGISSGKGGQTVVIEPMEQIHH